MSGVPCSSASSTCVGVAVLLMLVVAVSKVPRKLAWMHACTLLYALVFGHVQVSIICFEARDCDETRCKGESDTSHTRGRKHDIPNKRFP